MTPLRTAPISSLVAIAAVLASPRVYAGNVEPVLVGREAVLTAGAVVATVQDAGAVWFNPAGLSAITRSSVDVSADAFVLRIYHVPGLIEARLPGQTATLDIDHAELLALPSAIVIARRLADNVTGAISLFTRAQAFVRDSDDLWARASLQASGTTVDPGGEYEYEQNLTFIQNSSIYHAGPTVSWRVTPDLQIGASVFGIFQNDRGSFQLWTNYFSTDGVETTRTVRSEQTEYSLRAIGGQVVLGAQAQLSEKWRVGLTYKSPSIVFKHWVGAGVVVARTQVSPGEEPTAAFFSQRGDRAGDDMTLVQPSRISLGVARQISTGHISLEGEIRPGFRNESWSIDLSPTWNARLGARFDLDETISVGGGFFTDRTASKIPTGITTTEIDSYGAALGLEFGTAYDVETDDGEKHTLVFSTTLGVRYALGVGRVGGVVLDGSSILVAPIPVVRDATFHELDVSLASSVNF
jgi:long-subunit fatty acid transport protein